MIAVTHARGADLPEWTLGRDRSRVAARDGDARLARIESAFASHPAVRVVEAAAGDATVDEALAAVHDGAYLEALAAATDLAEPGAPVLLADAAEPGVQPDTPVCRGSAAAAREAVRAALDAAAWVTRGAPLAYAVCRPPGHHAGPSWMGGYCYLNNAAAAAHALMRAGAREVAVLDLDLHYGNGTAAIAARLGIRFHSLHGSTLDHFPWRSVEPLDDRQRLHAFDEPPSRAEYLACVDEALAELVGPCDALVVSLGYDTVAGDPHGDWSLPPDVFAGVSRRLARAGVPVCVVQEGGYAGATLGDCARAFADGVSVTQECVT